MFVFSVQTADSSLLLPEVIRCGAAVGPGEVWLQANALRNKRNLNRNGTGAGKKQGKGKNPASVAVIGRLPGFCSRS